jgi:hypothetical protein
MVSNEEYIEVRELKDKEVALLHVNYQTSLKNASKRKHKEGVCIKQPVFSYIIWKNMLFSAHPLFI